MSVNANVEGVPIIFNWTSVNNAVSYQLEIVNSEADSSQTYTMPAEITSCELDLEAGKYKANVYTCREVNDLHHAKDAYLNIVVGNVFNTKSTENPLNFIRENKNYSIKLLKKDKDGKISGIMNHSVERDGNIAWDPQTSATWL